MDNSIKPSHSEGNNRARSQMTAVGSNPDHLSVTTRSGGKAAGSVFRKVNLEESFRALLGKAHQDSPLRA